MTDFTQKDLDRAKQDGQLLSDVSAIKDKVTSIEHKLERDFVTQDQFTPVRNLVYGLVGLTLTSVVVALLALVIINKQ